MHHFTFSFFFQREVSTVVIMTDYVEERTDRTAVVDWVCCIKVYVHILLLLIVDRSPGIESRSSLDVRERQEEEPGTRMQSYTLTHSLIHQTARCCTFNF